MNRALILALAALVAASTACGGGSGHDSVVGDITAGFVPLESNPGNDTVSAGEGSSSGNQVTVVINLTDTNGVYAAAFDLNYDPSVANYLGYTEGDLFEQGGHTPIYEVAEPQAGQLVVGVSRQGSVPGVDASGTVSIVGLTFEVLEATAQSGSIVSFDANELLDDQALPQPIPDIDWFGGWLTGTE